jgi:hypothetical protein
MTSLLVAHWYERNHLARANSPKRVAARRQALHSAGSNYSVYRSGRPAYVKRRSKASQQVLEHVVFIAAVTIVILGAGIAGGVTGY